MRQLLLRRVPVSIWIMTLIVAACAPAAQPAAAPAAPAAAPAAAPKQPQAPALAAPAAAPRAPSAPVAAPAPAPAAPKGPQRGGILNYWETSEAPHLDPVLLASITITKRAMGSYQRLIRYKTGPGIEPNEVVLVPDLAESWEVSKDGLTFTFHLRKGVKWQNLPPVNGREFVADDVVWSYNRIAKTPGSVFGSTWFASTEKIEALDRYTVRITNKEPNASFLLNLAYGTAVIMPREVAEADGDLKKRVIGTGPFIMKERVVNVVTKARANPDYWEPGIPYLDGFDIYNIPERSAIVAAFRAGKLDHFETQSKSDVDSVLRTRPDTQLLKFPRENWGKFFFRTDKAPWNNQKLRQAISVALDRQGEIDTLFNGEGKFLGPLGIFPGWELPIEKLGEASKYWKHDVQYAKRLLTEAGYPNGVELPFIMRNRPEFMERSLFYNNSLLKAGIKLKIQVMDNAEWLTTAYIGKYEGASAGYGGSSPDAGDSLWLLHHPASETWNQSHVNDPFVTKMLDEQKRTLDEKQRMKIIHDLQPYLAEKMYYVPWTTGMQYVMVNGRIKGGLSPTTGQNGADIYRYVWIEGAK